ncbi:MAG: hypothetical protein H6741_32910 [Alphaproteobacteria bacterium]|nr:hypothetical protein [Alphaproteobacteria bacterium]MCB9797517.1 hypothetical protein [Alphaproteobacteria bacterium]
MRRWIPLLALTLSATALAEGPEAEKAEASAAERAKAASQLPAAADELRQAGVAEEEVGKALQAGKKDKVSPKEMKDILDSGRDATKEHGPVDNFGAFVQGQLDEGKRGQDLAAAIRAEHEAHGKKHHGGEGGEHGKSDEHGKDGEHGKADEHGKPADKGQPANKGGEKAGPADKGAEKGADKGGERKGGAPADNKGGAPADNKGGGGAGNASKGGGRK